MIAARLLAAAFAISLLAGCGAVSNLSGKFAASRAAKKREKALKEAAAAGQPELAMGEVTFVQPGASFILYRGAPIAGMAQGTPLEARSPDTGEITGRLTFSPERKQGFGVADITAGIPQVGDKVVFVTGRTNPDAVEEAPAPAATASPADPIRSGPVTPEEYLNPAPPVELPGFAPPVSEGTDLGPVDNG